MWRTDLQSAIIHITWQHVRNKARFSVFFSQALLSFQTAQPKIVTDSGHTKTQFNHRRFTYTIAPTNTFRVHHVHPYKNDILLKIISKLRSKLHSNYNSKHNTEDVKQHCFLQIIVLSAQNCWRLGHWAKPPICYKKFQSLQNWSNFHSSFTHSVSIW